MPHVSIFTKIKVSAYHAFDRYIHSHRHICHHRHFSPHSEYYFGTRQWWLFLAVGIATLVAALFIDDVLTSSLLGIFGASCLWSIGELFEQKKRVEKGWFPKNPRRAKEYKSR